MAEIEFSVLARACLRGRNDDEKNLGKAVNACVSERNRIAATIDWPFMTGPSPPRTQGANSTASTRANLDLTQY